jgi:uroporphyrin-III C-methyltransferase/precorrin-2 dehydrogenase/sirohydrochlorin ferrochelatase
VIRRKIETLLPRHLKEWAELALSIRGRVSALLDKPAAKRNFWETFSDMAFEGPLAPFSDEEVLVAARGVKDMSAFGRVTLVGAGPGDAELLTLKAVRALQSADVILFDDLVSTEVLELARREAKRMLVGKRGGRESCRQEDINDMMVKLAKAGKHVVRLKSGDPMIFGRAGEEIAHLDRENISVDVIPGITAASAMAARLGISLTHRDHSQSVRLITGHSRHGGLPTNINWSTVADPHTTAVFYMGGRTAPLIAARLIAEGLTSSTPVVIMSDISRDTQMDWHGTLETVSAGIAKIGYDNPVLIAVGQALTARAIRGEGTAGISEPAARMAAW